MKIEVIGIDIDTNEPRTLQMFEDRMKTVSHKFNKMRSKHGWHYRLSLKRPVEDRNHVKCWILSFEVRHFCGDDPQRICFDLFKVIHGFEIVDVLFTEKWDNAYWENWK